MASLTPWLGMPELPVIEVLCGGPGFGWSAKTGAIQRWIGDRPLVWIDD
ncbi:hypothetical protein [Amycolatopsis sp. 195334CR]|nr:hypothetical protein [Amycolatopsis sp. 195334CR]MBN6034085.1 hypothetical protein [Amycolatopsis sp. 195334CR]